MNSVQLNEQPLLDVPALKYRRKAFNSLEDALRNRDAMIITEAFIPSKQIIVNSRKFYFFSATPHNYDTPCYQGLEVRNPTESITLPHAIVNKIAEAVLLRKHVEDKYLSLGVRTKLEIALEEKEKAIKESVDFDYLLGIPTSSESMWPTKPWSTYVEHEEEPKKTK